MADTTAHGRVALEVTGGIQVNTRAHDDQWEQDDEIGIYMVHPGVGIELADNRYYTTAGGTSGKGVTFNPATGETIYFPSDISSDLNMNFYAYYPYQENVADGIYKVDVAIRGHRRTST